VLLAVLLTLRSLQDLHWLYVAGMRRATLATSMLVVFESLGLGRRRFGIQKIGMFRWNGLRRDL
jgi:hypothetical protein